jgi:hypothetical protein
MDPAASISLILAPSIRYDDVGLMVKSTTSWVWLSLDKRILYKR